MSLSVIPTNIGGFSLPFAQLQGPLSSLFQSQNPQNLMYPSDLGSNPAMGHAVLFQVFDYKSGFTDAARGVLDSGKAAINAFANLEKPPTIKEALTTVGGNMALPVAKLALAATTAASYQRKTKTQSLANISLYMPETLNVTYNSNYTDVSLTESLGVKGLIGNAISESMRAFKSNGAKGVQSVLVNEYGAAAAAKYAGNILGANIGDLINQAAGIYINPQIQLLYKGVSLRTFQLEFIFTPKSAAEAQQSKDICDSFAFYSLPGLAGAAGGEAGQFLTPPQLFSISFKFLGQNDILGSVGSVFTSALSNLGLGINTSNSVTNGKTAKIMTINDCVLQNVQIDYAPNGWAAYNDGHPVQTRLTLQFMEMQLPTKESIQNSRIKANYNPYQGNADNTNITGVASDHTGGGSGGLAD